MSPTDMKLTKKLGSARTRRPLSAEERAVYEWQFGVAGFGEEGQKSLKSASVLVTRVGGVGGAAATALAAAGIGRLVLVHQGNVRSSDLNRQTLMTADWVGKPRVESALRRIKDLNPRVAIEIHNVNIGEDNVEDLVASADLVPQATVDVLTAAYRAFRGRSHHLSLAGAGAIVADTEFVVERAAVTHIWNEAMGV